MSIFCQCAKCGCNIVERDQFYSITLSRDLVEPGVEIQPLVAESPAVWCLKCGPEAVKDIIDFTNGLIGHTISSSPLTNEVVLRQ